MTPLHNLFPWAAEVPASWLSILSAVQTATGLTPVLAGGALRDHFHGVPVKDLDIFLPHTEGIVRELRGLFEDMGFECFQSIGMSCDGLNDCRVVLGFRDRAGLLLDVNLIFLDPETSRTPEEIVGRIDFGICQIGVFFNELGRAEFFYTDAFVGDVAKLTFTLTRQHDRERSLRRFDRLSDKYPYHRLVVS